MQNKRGLLYTPGNDLIHVHWLIEETIRICDLFKDKATHEKNQEVGN